MGRTRHILAVTLVATAFWGVITLSKALADRIVSCLKQIDDGRARERIFATSQEEIRLISDNELVSMIFAMRDGARGDDDKEAILKILEALDCEERIRIVNRIGVAELLDNADGSDWDRLIPADKLWQS